MSTINPYENGIHSIAKALEAFAQFHSKPDDPYALKDALLRSHHGLETLLKAYLQDENPTLILDEQTRIREVVEGYVAYRAGSQSFLFPESRTIGLVEALERLRALGRLAVFSEEEYQSLKRAAIELVDTRNRLQHLGLSADLEVAARPLGNLLPRIADVFRKLDPNFVQRLLVFFGGSEEVLLLLRTEYDELILKAVNFFRGRTFENVPLVAAIRDHGEVGAPPYYPEIEFEGLLALKLDPHEVMFRGMGISRLEGDIAEVNSYTGSVTVDQPITLEADRMGYSLVQGKIQLSASFSLTGGARVFSLEGGADHFGYLRDIRVDLSAVLDYKARALLNVAHFSIDQLESASGTLLLEISALPRGYAAGTHKGLKATLVSPLDPTSAGFRLHAFVGPGGIRSVNRSVDWHINVSAPLKFA